MEEGRLPVRSNRGIPRVRLDPSPTARIRGPLSKPHASSSDGSFEDSEGSSDSDSDAGLVITNEELASNLTRKTIPAKSVTDPQHPPPRAAALGSQKLAVPAKHARGKRARAPTGSQAKRARLDTENSGSTEPLNRHCVMIEEVPDADAAPSTTAPALPIPSALNQGGRKCKGPIYHFFEIVDNNASGEPGDDGDIHYRCFHGDRKVVTVKRKANHSQNGLVKCLQARDALMYRLYEKMKVNVANQQQPDIEELRMAANLPPVDSDKAALIRSNLKLSKLGVLLADDKTVEGMPVEPWDQVKFERLLTEWIVVSDQPFSEVENEYFRRLLRYTHNCGRTLKIPSPDTIHRRVQKMGEENQAEMKAIFQSLHGGVSLSLDAWTSSNGYAFMAIVVHYITNDWRLEEFLLDFQELIGQHTGENMAESVWSTLVEYGLVKKLVAINCDNATNNDTLVEALAEHISDAGIPFVAQDARICCFPHTGHLSALKLMEGIGAISKSDVKAAEMGNFQDNVTLSTSREVDDAIGTAADEGEAAEDSSVDDLAACSSILPAIEKLRAIVRSVRSSPQRCASWREHVKISLQDMDDALTDVAAHLRSKVPLMLILDVRTRWSSTHQMLRRVYDFKFKDLIDIFVASPQHKALRKYELSESDWSAIRLVKDWL